MSGRGLGFSGGTLDKMESIPGFRSDLTKEEFLAQLQRVGLVLAGQTGDLAPADGKLYALRDVTGTVQSIPLIASSVMSKKIAAGAQAIVLDVKVGNGAFMKSLSEAQELARLMAYIAHLSGRKAVALISDMNQPLGYAVGTRWKYAKLLKRCAAAGRRTFASIVWKSPATCCCWEKKPPAKPKGVKWPLQHWLMDGRWSAFAHWCRRKAAMSPMWISRKNCLAPA